MNSLLFYAGPMEAEAKQLNHVEIITGKVPF